MDNLAEYLKVFTRISGILVAAIAVGLVVEGLGMLYPSLAVAR